MADETIDLAIVGAGWHGLAMAKTYSQVYPEAHIVVFDSAKSVGGVWAKERLYPGLKTNNLVGSYEFGDFPMSLDRFGLQSGQHIPGAVVHEYLRQFAEEFNLISRLRFTTKVTSVGMLDNGEWTLQVLNTDSEASQARNIRAKKLVVATGLTSKPSIPNFPGQGEFKGKVFHSIHLKERAKDIEAAKEMVVLGANKSAWDTCYSAAVAGAHVSMVIRPSGGGPSWVWPVTFSPFKLSIQRLATTRLWTLFEPCIWDVENSGFSWMRYLLHRTYLGRKIVSAFWKALDMVVQRANGYDNHPELQKLKPWSTTFWMGNSLGIHNYQQNWFDLVRKGRINIHVADITSLSGHGVHLSNGAVVDADTFVCCTGWEILPPIKFSPETLINELGLPSASFRTNEPSVRDARVEILRTVPSLCTGPNRILPASSAVPVRKDETRGRSNYQLYRLMVPSSEKFINHRNIAFIGAHLALNAITVAQAQALWITAFFTDQIDNLSHSQINHREIEYQTILHSEYARLRHPAAGSGAGERCPDLVFDGLLYTDLLLRDLGVESHRKKTLWKELIHRYLPGDYQGMVSEWKRKRIG